jgi:hypothetical protein
MGGSSRSTVCRCSWAGSTTSTDMLVARPEEVTLDDISAVAREPLRSPRPVAPPSSVGGPCAGTKCGPRSAGLEGRRDLGRRRPLPADPPTARHSCLRHQRVLRVKGRQTAHRGSRRDRIRSRWPRRAVRGALRPRDLRRGGVGDRRSGRNARLRPRCRDATRGECRGRRDRCHRCRRSGGSRPADLAVRVLVHRGRAVQRGRLSARHRDCLRGPGALARAPDDALSARVLPRTRRRGGGSDRCLERAVARSPLAREWARGDTDLDSLRDEPRFKELVGA